MNKIVLDCERMKYADTGIYHYCLNLGNHLAGELDFAAAQRALSPISLQAVSSRAARRAISASLQGELAFADNPDAGIHDLGIEGGALYDPEVNYRRVKGQLWDWADDPKPQQQATDTRAVPEPDAGVPAYVEMGPKQ